MKKRTTAIHTGYCKTIIALMGVCELIIAVAELAVISFFSIAMERLIADRLFQWQLLDWALLLGIVAAGLKRLLEIWKSNYKCALTERESEWFFERLRAVRDREKVGATDRLQMLNSSIPELIDYIVGDVPKLIGTVLALVVYIAYGVWVNPLITALVCLIAGGITLYQYRSSQGSTADYTAGEELEAESDAFLRKSVENSEIVQVMLDPEKISRNAERKLEKVNNVWLGAMQSFFTNSSLGTCTYHITGFVAIAFGLLGVVRGTINVGGVYSIFRVSQSIMSYITQLPNLYQSRTKAEGAAQFLGGLDDQGMWEGKRKPERIERLTFAKVSFSYSGETIVSVTRELSATFEAGKFYKIVGQNGTGKSTLGKIFCGMLEIQGGRICADDLPVWELDRDFFQRQVRYCGQSCGFFPGTVLENIAGIERDAEKTTALLKEIGGRVCGNLAGRLQENMDSAQKKFSAGERQMIAFARAVYGDRPSFLVLDEITANMDGDTKQCVVAFLRKYCSGGIGVVMITHDRIADENFDRKWELADGILV